MYVRYAYLHTHTHTHTCIYITQCTCTDIHTHTHTKHTCVCTTNTCTHAHTHTHTHTHTPWQSKIFYLGVHVPRAVFLNHDVTSCKVTMVMVASGSEESPNQTKRSKGCVTWGHVACDMHIIVTWQSCDMHVSQLSLSYPLSSMMNRLPCSVKQQDSGGSGGEASTGNSYNNHVKPTLGPRVSFDILTEEEVAWTIECQRTAPS